ncbi:phosphonate ABC transporter, permease protein PhnE [Enterococcus dispar]|jgi:phosphonate transport system permease protein|uniref:Phosphonate ABC transporter, permease PhnE n=1 Tax=Enterococcus dispar ATCC 51266 TaxID=1139219 RepID=S0KIC6_9ENTE|nr:phosphonate ABC transporter, permease protein PhnE [Enterococcus dispar]EOT38916.1 phosphonate ABC transporter, permease PhnE [Enterococcus dispar ATCC 51266]EOW86183.1 phosphonate ABC transporter, permease PhnE [Enterococcus dispar ATCC 51266]MCU7357102.1 phosphonate ABC transporter, permease protein PhnE [Enterococcus dispar]MDT2705207.1 phosphonate ABC transporter, permease protein PhnE [Enterococcus dispar]OJG39181.1 phosphonate ABC transporter, permease PhnE [Enterococcus dispar]
MNTIVEKQLAKEPNKKVQYATIALIVVGMFIWSLTAIKINKTSTDGSQVALNILKGIVTPDLNFLFDFSNTGVAYLLFETICIGFLGTILGSIFSIPIAFLMSPSIMPKPVYVITRFLVVIIRTVPALVYGLMFVRVTGTGPFAGVMTMSVTSIGMVSRLYVDAIETIDTGVLESMSSIGATTFDKIRFGILPQLISNFVSITIYRFDMNLRDATILGLVGAGGIGSPLMFAINGYKWNQVGSILIGLIVLILIVEVVSNKIRAKLING